MNLKTTALPLFALLAVLSGCFTNFFTKDVKAADAQYCEITSLKKEITGATYKVYQVPVLEVNGEKIGDKNATENAEQKGIRYIQGNSEFRKED